MAVGRISGPLLKANLLRDGVNLAFETDLLFLDVVNGRVGIKTATPQYDLDVNGTTRSTNLEVTTNANIATFTLNGNTLSSSNGTINLVPSGTNPVVYQGKIVTGDLQLSTNIIETTGTDSDLNITTTGTGVVNVNSNMLVNGDLHATGTITADGDIQIGDSNTDNIVFNADINSNIIPDSTNTYNLGSDPTAGGKEWKTAYVHDITSTNVTLSSAIVNGIDLVLPQGKIYYVATNGNDTNAGVHENNPFASVKHALSVATSGDTVFVYPGTYVEEFPLTVPVGVTVRGEGLRSVKITPTTATRYNDAFLLNGETTVEDLTVADFFSNGNFFTVTAASAGSTTVNVGTAPFAHTYVSGGTITIGSTTYNIINAVYTYTTGVLVLTHTGGTATLGQSVFVSSLTFSCAGVVGSSTRIFPDNGYAFRFADNFTVTIRSPYIRNCTVITRGSVTSSGDPLGFDAQDAGRGAYIDGAYANAASVEASMLFHAVTFITPGVDTITAKNGVRVEWLNSFTYFANKGFNLISSNYGFARQGNTRLRIDTRSGTWAAGNTLTYYDTDGTTVLASGTIASVDGNYVNLTGKCLGFQTITDRVPKTIYAQGDAKLSTSIKKFGTASLALDGTGDYASIATQPDFGFGTDDFTIEFYVYRVGSGWTALVDMRTTTSSPDTAPYIGTNGSNVLYYGVNGSVVWTGTTPLPINTWTHVAVSKHAGVTKVFLNGTQEGTNYTDSNNYGTSKPVRIGSDESNAFNGYIDDVRISKGVARYTSNFTAPTDALTGDNNTVLLLHFNGPNNSTTFLDDGVTLQDLRTSAGGTASLINFADYSDFGAEVRAIGSASIYGNYGFYGDGDGVIAYLISQNFAYVGSGKLSTNDPNDRIHANEVVKLNRAKIYYTSVDNEGNFSVGDYFSVNQKSGEVTFNGQSFNITSASGVIFTDGVHTTTVLPGEIDTGNLKISGNTVESVTGDVNITAASGAINLQNNTYVTGNLDVTGDVTIGGNITFGNQTTDTIDFVAGINSDLIPATTATYDLGTPSLRWKDAYLNRVEIDGVVIDNNTISTTVGNDNLQLSGNGTGGVIAESVKFVDNIISSVGTNADLILTPQGTGSIIINGEAFRIPVGTTADRPTGENGMIRYNTDLNRYEGWNGSTWLALGGVQDADGNTKITAELTPGANDNTLYFYIDGVLKCYIDATKLWASRIETDELAIYNDTITTVATDTDINLTTSGSGSVQVGNLKFNNNTITNATTNGITQFVETGTGYIKIAGANGVVIPSGTNAQRPDIAATETGMLRFNTDLQFVEVYNGVTWDTVAGTSGGISYTTATSISIVNALLFG